MEKKQLIRKFGPITNGTRRNLGFKHQFRRRVRHTVNHSHRQITVDFACRANLFFRYLQQETKRVIENAAGLYPLRFRTLAMRVFRSALFAGDMAHTVRIMDSVG